MTKFKVYITDYDYPDNEVEKSVLEPIGAEVIGLQCKDGKGLAVLAKDANALLVQYAHATREIIFALKDLKVIARYGAGVDIVDVKAAYERGVICTNVPHYCTNEVADHNITLALMLIRRIPFYVAETKKGKWHWSETGLPVFRLNSLWLGLIGFGKIARNMARKAKALGFNLQTYDPYVDPQVPEAEGVKMVDLETLLKTSDVVCVQCPLTEKTYHLISEKELRMMKPTAVLLNCARAKIMDNKALYKGLKENWIASAALDDVEEEPAKRVNWKPEMNPLFTLDNCFITPHVAYYSEQAIEEARRTAAEEAAAVLLGKTPRYIVRPEDIL